MAFCIGIVAIRYGEEIRLKQFQRLVDVVPAQCKAHLCGSSHAAPCLGGGIKRQETVHQAYAHFCVGNVKRVKPSHLITRLDGDIATLIEQWND